MAFNINAHVILSGPKNIKAVTKRIQTQLGSVNARINLVTPKGLSKQIGSFNKGLSRLNKSITTLQSSATSANTHLQKLGAQFRSLNKSSSAMSKSQAGVQKSLANTGQAVGEVRNEIQAFGKDAALAIRRFAAFTVATGVVFGFVRAIQSATKAAIDYEREIVKIVQVTGASADKIGKLSKTIQQLSVSLGIDANELAELGRIFAQTGQTIDQVGDSIRAIARSSLAPSFGTMKSTAEGLIAAMAQFNIAASESESVLASLNAVSKKWAVEAEDMISVIRRAGGVFAASAGQMDDPKKALNELIGIFVAVRSTSRESADTIAVGLRTIFTRIQRRGTIEFLKQFNIELIDAKGNFIGLFPAFQELSRGLSDIIKKGDALTLSAITEELGGVRQVGKLIPAITQFNKALAATKVAGEAAAAGLGKDVALALKPLGKQFEVLQQRFNALIRDITQTKSFQNMAKIALSMAHAFLSVAETLKPLVPLMATFAAIKLSKGLFQFGQGFMGGLKKGGGAGGVGGALGGVVTGGGGGGGAGASGGAARSISVQQALTSAIKSHSILLSSNNMALKQLGTQVIGNTAAINTTGGKVAAVSTQIIGAMGSLINALNRKALGGLGGGKKFARGGYVSGPSHSQGGVPAELEGGEYVIPKGYAEGDVVKNYKSGRPYMVPKEVRHDKPKGIKFAGVADIPHRFNESDKISYTRTEETVDVDTLYPTEKEKKTGTAKEYFSAARKRKHQERGLAFEKVLKEKNIIKTLVGGSARLDAITKGDGVAEIKSIKETLSKIDLGNKMIGAAISGSFASDKIVSDRLKAEELTGIDDPVNLGNVTVFQDRRPKKEAADKKKKAPATKKKKTRRSSRGGIVYMQAGGLLKNDSQVGAAVLEDIDSFTEGISVTHKDINLRGQSTNPKFPKDKRLDPKFVANPKQYKFTKQGLGGDRSKQFTNTFMENLRLAAERSAQALGADLGLNTAIPDSVINQFEKSVNPGAVGGLFDDTLRVLNGPPFNTDTGAPFDFSAGLTERLRDDFTDLTMQYVDARKSGKEANKTDFKKKITSQLAREALKNQGLISETAAQKKTRVSAGYQLKPKKAMKRAAGGSIFAPQGTDTVPAMLTPGEFVVNKKSAQSFGYGNLKKINNYAKGGSVGVPRKTSAPVKKKAKDKKKFVEKSRFMKMNMATGGQDGDDWNATFFGAANAPDEMARGKKILGMKGYLDFDADSSEFGLHILNTDELSIPSLKKQGYGSAAYKKLYDWTVKKQIGFFSDGMVTTSAAKVWQNLKKHYGIPIEQIATNIHENRIPTSPTGEMRLGTNDDVDALFGARMFAAGGIAQHLAGGTGGRGVQMLKHRPPPAPKRKVPRKKQRKLFSTGPVEIYHGSNSGPDDSIEQSFLQSGASSQLAGGYGQGAGFFGWSDYSTAKGHAKGASAEGRVFESGASTAGRPMVVVVKSIMEPRQWDLDYELNNALVNKWLYNNWDKVKDDLSGIINVKRSKKFEGNYETPAGKMAKRKGIRLTGSAAMKKDLAAGGARGEAMSGTPKLMTKGGGNIREGAATGTVMNELQKGTNKELMHAFEERFFANMPRATAVKYTGLSPLPVERIEKFAAGGSVGTDTIPAMLTPGEFVVNRKSAENFGYGNLKKINQYAKGGVAATGKLQYFDSGTDAEKRRTDYWDKDKGGMSGTDRQLKALNKTFDTLEAAVADVIVSYERGETTFEEMEKKVDKFGRGIKKTQEGLEEVGGSGARRRRPRDAPGPAREALERVRRDPRFREDLKESKKKKADAVVKAARKPKGDKDAAAKMEHFTTGVSSAVGAVAGFSAALSSVDFSSPEAAMASLMSLTFAISQAQAAIGAFAAMAKVSAAANAAAAASEGVETTSNLASAASEWLEVAANTARAVGGSFMTGMREGLSVLTGNLRTAGTFISNFGRSIAGLIPGLGGLGTMLSGLISSIGSGIGGLMAGGGGAVAMAGVAGGAATVAAGAAIAGIVTQKIGNMVDANIRGKKEEIAPGVSGVRGGTPEAANLAGGLKGAATGAAMGTMILPGIGTAVGALIGAVAGAITEKLAQAEFNAFVEMQDNLKGANEQLGRFAKLTDISRAALVNLNTAVGKPIQSFDKIQEASFAKAQGGIGWSNVLGNKGLVQRGAGFVTGTEPGGMMGAAASTGAGALAGAGIGAALGTLGGPLAPLTVAMGAFIGAVIGGTAGLITALVATDQTVKNTALSFDRAAQSITPEFIENLNKAFDQASGTLIDKLDMSQVRDLASMETVSQDLNPAEQAALTTSSFKEMNGILNSTTGETSAFVQELQRLSSIKIQAGLIDSIRAEADLLGEEGGQELKTAFVHLRDSLDIDQLVKDGDMTKVTDALKNSGLTEEHQKLVEGVIKTQMEGIVEGQKAKATQRLLAEAAKASRKALDALVAGLQQFGERTTGIAAQMGLVSDQMKTAFAQITGEATIGEFKKFNPFEHLAAATDKQIDSSISQIKEFGGSSPEGDVAFGGIGDMLKAGRDFPLAMRNIVDKIDAAETGGAKLDTQAVVDMVNEGFGGTLPDILKKSLEQKLESAPGRQGGGAFTSDMLRDMMEKGGGIHELLGTAFKATKEEMAKFDKTVVAMKNSLMEVARIQEQMAKHRLSSELAMLDKQEAIRDRVNQALGTSVGAFGQATDDLQKRVTIQLRGGLKPGQGVVGVPGGAGADVLDPEVLFARLKTIDDKRAETKAKLGLGSPEAQKKNNELLGKLNREMNGTVAALKTLASDTRKLAAIEAKIAGQQERGKGAQGTVDSILDGINKYMTGEMSVEDFNKNVTQPLSTVNRVFDDTQQVTFSEGLDFAQRVKSGDPAIAGWAEYKMRERAEAEGVDISDPAALKAFSKDFYKQLTIDLAAKGAAIGAQIGVPELGNVVTTLMGETFEAESEAEMLGNEMREVGAQQVSIMQKMLAREEALMATVLKNADEGFNTAVNAFQDAVTEFAIMRGGVTDAEMTSLDEAVQTAEAERRVADAAVAELVTDTVDAETGEITSVRTEAADAQITAAGDAAAEEAERAAVAVGLGPGLDPGSARGKERKSRIDTARANAEAEAEREMAQDIENKRHTAKLAGQTLESKTALRDKIKGQKELEERETVREERGEQEREQEREQGEGRYWNQRTERWEHPTAEGAPAAEALAPVATATDISSLGDDEFEARRTQAGVDLLHEGFRTGEAWEGKAGGARSKEDMAEEIELKELQDRATALDIKTDKRVRNTPAERGAAVRHSNRPVSLGGLGNRNWTEESVSFRRKDKTNEELRADIEAEESMRRAPVGGAPTAVSPAGPVTEPAAAEAAAGAAAGTAAEAAAAEAAAIEPAARPATPVVAEAEPATPAVADAAPATVATATALEDEASVTAAGGCCSDIVSRLDILINLFSEVATGLNKAQVPALTDVPPGATTSADDPRNAPVPRSAQNPRTVPPRPPVPPGVVGGTLPSPPLEEEAQVTADTQPGARVDPDADTDWEAMRPAPLPSTGRSIFEGLGLPLPPRAAGGQAAAGGTLPLEQAQVTADTQPGGPTQLQQDQALYQQRLEEGQQQVQGQDLNAIAAANRARKEKQETSIDIGSSAGRRPGDTAGKLSDFRHAQAASTSPGGRRGGQGGAPFEVLGFGRAGGRIENMTNRRKAKIDKRHARRKSSIAKSPDALQSAINKKTKRIQTIEETLAKNPNMSPKRRANLEATLKRLKGERSASQSLMPKRGPVGMGMGQLAPSRPSDIASLPVTPSVAGGTAPPAASDVFNQDHTGLATVTPSVAGGLRQPTTGPRRDAPRQQAGAVTLDQQGQSAAAPAPASMRRPGTSEPAAAGAGGNIEELLRGTAFAATVGEAFTAGGQTVFDQIKLAFKDVIPPIIKMQAELGAITVKIVGGDALKVLSENMVENMRGEITKAIRTQVIPSALNSAEGTNGQNSGNTGFNQKNPGS